MSGTSWTHTGAAQRVRFGVGSTEGLSALVRELGLRRVLLVSSERALNTAQGQLVRRQLGRSLGGVFAEAQANVPTSALQALLREARAEQPDSVVSLGGGSCIDLAKAMAHFLETEQGAPGMTFTDRPTIIHVALPTTYVGAAYTSRFGITDERTGVTTTGGTSTGTPVAVIVDPAAAPPTDTLYSAIGHAVEVACASDRSAEAEALALAGLRMIANSHEDPEVIGAAAVLCGRSMANASLGAVHGLAQLLGGRCGIPHGLAVAALLPAVLGTNADVIPEAVAEVGRALGDADDPLKRLVELLPVVRLGALGCTSDDLDAVSRLSQGNWAVQRNPRPLGEGDIRALLEDVA
ncbi:MAG: maleylacetate reductase [Acidimicrobiia bacterium]|nr:maleylacetate reductase [Acidimicrobiia bacterium]